MTTAKAGARSGRARATLGERRRWMACLGAALALHAASTLLELRRRSLPAHAAAKAALIPLFLEDEPDARGSEPGGGSRVPAASERPSVPEPQLNAPHAGVAVRTGRAQMPSAPAAEPSPSEDDLTMDVLAAALGDPLAAVRPRAQRRVQLDAIGRPDAPDRDARDAPQGSRSLGPGVGSHGGPGGNGHGAGVVGRRFAFGGPSGAFRADVCFIERFTKSLRQIKSCPPVVSFFTDVINVPPRRFNEGFPGVSERTEWFAIQYRGTFKVADADTYTFRLVSDDGAILRIDGYPIIDNDGQHLPRSQQMTITLEAGEHEFSLFYYQGPADFMALELYVARFDGPEHLFGPSI